MRNTSMRMPLTNGRRIKETVDHPHQDLILFQELHKREKERNIVTLLQPLSQEFEPNENHQLSIASAKKGSEFEFLAEKEKNDYDWLKTPPATPLFPSLEMDTKSPELIIQREIPILQPISRFAAATNCKLEAADKQTYGRSKPGNSNSKLPLRSVTSTTRRRSTVASNSPNQIKTKAAAVIRTGVSNLNQQRTFKSATDHNDMIITRKTKPPMTSRSGVVSPVSLVRSTYNIQVDFSNERLPNLRTEQQSLSATHDRSALAKSAAAQVITHLQRSRCTTELRRPPSCSSTASISGDQRRVRSSSAEGNMQLDIKYCYVNESDLINTSSSKGIRRNQTVLGSRMVQRVVSARSKVPTLEEKSEIPNSRFPIYKTSGFGKNDP